jgi:hypothetical protein
VQGWYAQVQGECGGMKDVLQTPRVAPMSSTPWQRSGGIMPLNGLCSAVDDGNRLAMRSWPEWSCCKEGVACSDQSDHGKDVDVSVTSVTRDA